MTILALSLCVRSGPGCQARRVSKAFVVNGTPPNIQEPRIQATRPLPPSTVNFRKPSSGHTSSKHANFRVLRKELSQLSRLERGLVRGITDPKAHEAMLTITDVLESHEVLNSTEIVSLAVLSAKIVLKASHRSAAPQLQLPMNLFTQLLNERMQELSISDICSVIWFYGSLESTRYKPSRIEGVYSTVRKLCLRIECDKVTSLKDAVQLFTGLQKMQFLDHSELTQHVLRRLGPDLKAMDVNVDELSSLILLSAKLNVSDSISFLRYSCREVRNRFGEFSDRAMPEFVRGFSLSDISIMPEVFDKFTQELHKRLESMDIYCLIHAMLHLTKISYRPSDHVLSSFAERLSKELYSLNGRDITACIRTLSNSNYYSQPLLDDLINQFCLKKNDLRAADICHALIASIQLNALTKEVLLFGLEALKPDATRGLNKLQKLEIHQVLIHAKIILQMETIPEEYLPKDWEKACLNEWKMNQNRPVQKATAHIWRTTKQLGLEVVHERTPISDISISYVRSPNGDQKVVLDLFNCKSHCYLNQPTVMVPWKLWQYRILGEQGFQILSMDTDRWAQVPETAKLRHLARRLDFWTLEEIEEIEAQLGIWTPMHEGEEQ